MTNDKDTNPLERLNAYLAELRTHIVICSSGDEERIRGLINTQDLGTRVGVEVSPLLPDGQMYVFNRAAMNNALMTTKPHTGAS